MTCPGWVFKDLIILIHAHREIHRNTRWVNLCNILLLHFLTLLLFRCVYFYLSLKRRRWWREADQEHYIHIVTLISPLVSLPFARRPSLRH